MATKINLAFFSNWVYMRLYINNLCEIHGIFVISFFISLWNWGRVKRTYMYIHRPCNIVYRFKNLEYTLCLVLLLVTRINTQLLITPKCSSKISSIDIFDPGPADHPDRGTGRVDCSPTTVRLTVPVLRSQSLITHKSGYESTLTRTFIPLTLTLWW